ncbi:MAG: phage Gp37/Gp68 family protein [Mycobacterium sp.]
MSARTHIEWTRGDDGSPGATWNVADGCTRISAGCDHCYIERQPPFRMEHRRFDGVGIGSTTGVRLYPHRLVWPLGWKKPTRIFVCSLADLFHKEIPDEYIAQVWAVMALAPRHIFQVLTKRHDRMRSLIGSPRFAGLVYQALNSRLAQGNPHRIADETIMAALDGFARGNFMVLPNVWLMVTGEDAQWLQTRGDALRATPAAVRGVSIEPLLGPIEDADLSGLDWVIVGGESGPGARPMHPDWARSLRDQSQAAGVAFSFKQWGDWAPESFFVHKDSAPAAFLSTDGGFRLLVDGKPADAPSGDITVRRVGKKTAGRTLDRRTWDQYPQLLPAVDAGPRVAGRREGGPAQRRAVSAHTIRID